MNKQSGQARHSGRPKVIGEKVNEIIGGEHGVHGSAGEKDIHTAH